MLAPMFRTNACGCIASAFCMTGNRLYSQVPAASNDPDIYSSCAVGKRLQLVKYQVT